MFLILLVFRVFFRFFKDKRSFIGLILVGESLEVLNCFWYFVISFLVVLMFNLVSCL